MDLAAGGGERVAQRRVHGAGALAAVHRPAAQPGAGRAVRLAARGRHRPGHPGDRRGGRAGRGLGPDRQRGQGPRAA
ncbi:hypothetical protein V2I01_28740 [Micromonospora sp. BRA006-A]|nr:hypothetical protein [Micromonospora sp. BRA006-A]